MEEKKEIQIELSAEVAEGIYSNLSIISCSVGVRYRLYPHDSGCSQSSGEIAYHSHGRACQTIVIRLAGQHTQIRSSIRAYTNERSSTGRYASFHGSRRGSLTTDRRRILSNSLSFRV